jgi:hypothetical protein
MEGLTLRYDGFEPSEEGLREALTSTGDGYPCTRGAAEWEDAGGVTCSGASSTWRPVVDPRPPARLDGPSFAMELREAPIRVSLADGRLTLAAGPEGLAGPVKVGVDDDVRERCPGEHRASEPGGERAGAL